MTEGSSSAGMCTNDYLNDYNKVACSQVHGFYDHYIFLDVGDKGIH